MRGLDAPEVGLMTWLARKEMRLSVSRVAFWLALLAALVPVISSCSHDAPASDGGNRLPLTQDGAVP